MKELIQRPRKNVRNIRIILDILVYLFLSIRLLSMAYIATIDCGSGCDFQQYDPVANYFYLNRRTYDPFFFVIMFLMATFGFICTCLLYRLKSNNIVWQFWYKFVVENQDIYYQCIKSDEEMMLTRFRYEEMIKSKIPRAFKVFRKYDWPVKLLAKCIIWINFDNINKRKFFSHKIEELPDISNRLRKRLLLMLILADKFCYFYQILYRNFLIIEI